MTDRHWLRRLCEPRTGWQLLETYLQVVEAGSLRKAAIEGPAALNTMRDRIEKLEHLAGHKLVDRTINGIVVTPAGEAVLIIARAMAGAREAVVDAMIAEDTISHR